MDPPTNKGYSTENTPPQPSEITGFQKVYPNERDDNLPEVYVNDAPQALSDSEAHKAEVYSDSTSPKFSVADTLRTPVEPGHEIDSDRLPGGGEGKDGTAKKEGRICGLRRKWFFIALGVILVIVIAAAVGGGVGGAVASSASGDGSGDSDGSGGEETPSPTSTSGTSS